MRADFSLFSIYFPVAAAIAIARTEEDRYSADVIDQVLLDNPGVREAVESLPIQDVKTVLNELHVGDHGTDQGCRCRLIYLASRRITTYLAGLDLSPVPSKDKYLRLRDAYRELLDHHLRSYP